MVLFGSDDFDFDANASPGPDPSELQLEWNENTSDFDESSDGDDDQLDLNTDLIGVNRTTKDLNIVNTYRPRWTCKEAFRESYQNWRDGILKSVNLKLSQLRPTYTENKRKRVILIEAHHPESKELLGFIQFKYDKDGYCVGGLKIVNFKATLKYRNLGTGATTKAYDDGQTGQHGDGMKISALVYRRNNYNVRYESSSFKWRFLFKKGSLACSLTRINETSLKKMMKKARGQPRTHDPHPWEDVCLVVGAPGPTRDIYGRRRPGQRLSITDFKRWITVTLDIDPPQNIIRTSHGDLIRDPNYRGHMYLRGLRLPRGGTRGNNYKYGYNFVEGSTSSDRDALTGEGEESEGISAIWTAAIRTDQSTNSELVSDYTELLLSSINKMGDVMLHIDDGEDELMKGDIARQVWAKMLTLNTDGEGRAAFYYSAAEGKDVHIIEKSLRQNPVPIDPELWRILRKYFLCRAPKDELLHRFKSAKLVKFTRKTGDPFAIYMRKLLKTLLLSSSATQDMNLSFVEGEHLNIDAGFFAGTWKVHNKWLTWEGAHDQAFCEDQPLGELFSCDHAVLQLWDVMISQLMANGEHPQVVSEERWLKSMARSRLAEMPRVVRCSPTVNKGVLLVTWQSIDSHRHNYKPVRVVLHQQGCQEDNRQDNFFIHHNDRLCSCPDTFSVAVSAGVRFTGLNPSLRYVPCVSIDIEGAFIAPLPRPTKPMDSDGIVAQIAGADADPILPSVETSLRSNDAEPVRPRSNYEAPHVSDDDEIGDNCSLYQPRSTSSPLSIPMAPPSPPAPPSPKPPPMRRQPIRVDLAKKLKEDSYTLGNKIEHKSLDWGGSFPGSHDFYRTHEKPDQETYILKPKAGTKKPRYKRVQSGAEERGSAKKSRTDTVADRAAPPPYIVLSSPEPEDDVETPNPQGSRAVGSGMTDVTPLPERGIVYRY